MEEFELRTLVNQVTANILSMSQQQGDYIAIYVSVVFAFIAAVYVAGRNLSAVQATVATTLFTLVCLWLVYRITMLGLGINFMLTLSEQEYISRLVEDGRGWREALSGGVRVVLTAGVWSLGMIGALVFLWDVRRDKNRPG